MTYDWFKSYEDVPYLLFPVIPDKMARILILGRRCGKLTLAEDVRVSALMACLFLITLRTVPGPLPRCTMTATKYRQRQRTPASPTIRVVLRACFDTLLI